MHHVRLGLAVLLLAVASCECAPTEETHPFALTIGTRNFTGDFGTFVVSDKSLIIKLDPGGGSCDGSFDGTQIPVEIVTVTLSATNAAGAPILPPPGKYGIAPATAQLGRQATLSLQTGFHQGFAEPQEERAVSGTITLTGVGSDLVLFTIDVKLSGGDVVRGTVEAGTCTVGAPGGTTGGVPPSTSFPVKDLKVVRVEPSAVFVEGGDILTIETENGCDRENISITVNSIPVPAIQSTQADRFAFSAPPADAERPKVVVPVSVTCAAPPKGSFFKYGRAVAEAALTYDPDLEPQPLLKSYGPVSTSTSGTTTPLDAVMVVAFSRPIDRATVDVTRFRIDDVPGTLRFSVGDDTTGYKVVEYVPAAPLAPDREYTCVVTNEIRSKFAGKRLRTGTTAGSDDTSERWTFRTTCADCTTP